jgi:hypothetical protein
MEPSPAPTNNLEAEQHVQTVNIISRMMFLGLYQHIDELIEGYPYEVVVVDNWGSDIFVIYNFNLIDVFRVIQIPRRCHETFTRFFCAS